MLGICGGERSGRGSVRARRRTSLSNQQQGSDGARGEYYFQWYGRDSTESCRSVHSKISTGTLRALPIFNCQLPIWTMDDRRQTVGGRRGESRLAFHGLSSIVSRPQIRG